MQSYSHLLAAVALDLVRERSLEAERRAQLLAGAAPMPRSRSRRWLEHLACRFRTTGPRSNDARAIGGPACA